MPAKPTDLERIGHMIEGIKKIFSYTDKLSLKDFLDNELVQDAVIKNFEVIGEAAYHISTELKTKHDHLAWTKIQGIRHVLVHDYYQINPEILWNTKEDHLDDLWDSLEKILYIESEN